MFTDLVSAAVIDLGDFEHPSPESHAVHFAGKQLSGQPLANRMARRLQSSILIDQVFIVGSNIPTHVLTSGLSAAETLNFPTCHACERLAGVVDRTKAEWVFSVPANRPFIDPELVDKLLARALKTRECDFVAFASRSDDETLTRKLGLVGEACHGDTLRRMRRYADRLPESSSSISQWLANIPGAYHLKYVPLPEGFDRRDLRFVVEDANDWACVKQLCETLPDFAAATQEVIQCVARDQRLRHLMLERNA